MSVASGTRLGPYRVDVLVGEGGMGQVYRGVDTRLDRVVAIKVLPAHLSSHPQLRERFEREARAISSLSHPNICTLFDVGRQDGTDYLVMEYLEGQTLADRLARGPLLIHEAIRYGTEIADALVKAHRHGIVHRDLKPGNVMLTRSGAKLLDFGLAKTTTSPVFAPDAPTEQLKPLTTEGTLLGTFQYMAPEQLEGLEADARTDIFAFGTLLYEMVTGKRAFEGRTKTSLIAAIVDRDPPSIAALQPLAPPLLERIIRTCLAKDPDDRWQTAHDLLLQLRWVSEQDTEAGRHEAGRHPWRTRWILALAAVTLLAAGAAGMFLLRDGDRPAGERIEFEIHAPAGSRFDAVDGPLVVSPDGRSIAAYFGSERQIVIRDLSSLAIKRLPDVGDAYDLFWSPDSRSLGFFSGSSGKLMRIEVAGGPPRTLATAGDSRGATWSKSGVIVFAAGASGGLSQVSANGGPVTAVTTIDPRRESGHWRPAFLPDGEHFLYFSRGAKNEPSVVYVGSLQSMKPVPLMPLNTAPAFAPPHHLLFFSETSLFAQKIDMKRWKIEGEPQLLAENVEYSPLFGSLAASASANGVLGWQQQSTVPKTSVFRLDRTGKEVAILPDEGGRNLDLSRDDAKLAYERIDARARSSDIWVLDLQRGSRSRLTFDPAFESGPVWSPDGAHIAFSSNQEGGVGLYRKSTSGSGEETILFPLLGFFEPVDWSRDGRFLIFEAEGNLQLLPIQGGGKPIALAEQPNILERSGRFSPDTRYVTYASNEAGRDDVYVQPIPPTGAKWQISTKGGTAPRWRGDGKEILYVDEAGKLQSVAVSTAGAFESAAPKELFDLKGKIDYAVTHDGRTIYLSRTETTPPVPIRVMLNWNAPAK